MRLSPHRPADQQRRGDVPPKQVTKDGFELQFGTNHLGAFALTGLLLENLLPVEGSRVVAVSSIAHRIQAAIHFDDLQWERSYNRVAGLRPVQAGQLLFTYELQRRLAGRRRADDRRRRTPRHLQHRAHAPHPGSGLPGFGRSPACYQSAEMGALATLRAATDPAVQRRPVLRPRRVPRAARPPGAGRVQRAVPRSRTSSAGCGPSPRNSPASPTRSEGQ